MGNMCRECSEYGNYVAGMLRIWEICGGNAQNMVNMWRECCEYEKYVARMLRIWEICV